jgi:Mg-chelatase subunit ChlI
MRKAKLTLSVLSTLTVPVAGAHVSTEVRPFATSLDATTYARQVMSDQAAQVQGMLVASGEVRDVVREQIRTRVETGEFGESELGDKGDDLPGTKPDDGTNDDQNETGDDSKDDQNEKGDDSKDDQNETGDDSKDGQNETGDDTKDDLNEKGDTSEPGSSRAGA